MQRIDGEPLFHPAKVEEGPYRGGIGAQRLHLANDTISPKLFERKSRKKAYVSGCNDQQKSAFGPLRPGNPGRFHPNALRFRAMSRSNSCPPKARWSRCLTAETKVVCFVRDFEAGETWRDHRAFSTRPKSAGLWVRLLFRDGDSVEGMLANNLLLVEPAGFSIIPPDPTFQNQRLFVPKPP